MDHRDGVLPDFDWNPLLALANWLLVNIRAILFFFENRGMANLNDFVQWLLGQGFQLSYSVAAGFDKLRDAQLVHELNEFLKGLLRFSTRNRGQVQYIDHSLGGDLMRVLGRDHLPPRLRQQVQENLIVLTDRHFELIRTNVDEEPSTSEDTVQPSFEEEMESRLNISARHVGPERRFGGFFRREEVSDSHEGNVDASSSSSSQFGFPTIQESSQRPSGGPSNARTVPQHDQPLISAPEAHGELESFSDSWIGNAQDCDNKEEEQQLEMSSLSIEQPSTSQYSQPAETDEKMPSSHKHTHSEHYFMSVNNPPELEPESEPKPIDLREEFRQKVQEAIGNGQENARKIFDEPRVEPAENKFSTNNEYQSSSFMNGCAPMVSGENGFYTAVASHSNPFHMPFWGHLHPLAGNYHNNLQMENCQICEHLIYPDHEVDPCLKCYIRYHAKCLADSARRMEKCLFCKGLLTSDRDPYE